MTPDAAPVNLTTKNDLSETPEIVRGVTPAALNASLWVDYTLKNTLDLDIDRRATRQYFLTHVNPNTRFFHSVKEKLKFMVAEGYYDKSVIEVYSWEFLESIYAAAFAYKYRFSKYISASSFYGRMAVRDLTGKTYLERFEDRVVMTALDLARGSEDDAMRYMRVQMTGSYQPATPTFQNSGRKTGGERVSCFILPIVDSLTSIFTTLGEEAELSKLGGGVGICGTNVRAKSAPIQGRLGLGRGSAEPAKLYENTANYVDQLGTRPGAASYNINALHMDAPGLLQAKRAIANRDVKLQLNDLHLCMVIPDVLMEKAAAGESIALFCPHDVLRVTGKSWTDILIDDWYDILVRDITVRREVRDARSYLTEMSFTQSECGEPYVMFEGTVNRANPIAGIISATNICTEILQSQRLPTLFKLGGYSDTGRAVSCVVGSISVHDFLHQRNFAADIATAIDMLTATSDMTDIAGVPPVAAANRAYHSIGLGVMDYAGFLISEEIIFGSEASKRFTDMFFETMRFWALTRSTNIARERNTKFEDFELSAYADGSALQWYVDRDRTDPEVVQNLVEKFNIPVPTKQMWIDLIEHIKVHGLYHSYLMAIAPTGNISYVRGVTPSLGPAPLLIEKRENDLGKTYYPAAHLTNENKDYYPLCYDIDYRDFIDVYAEAGQHIDQGMAMTIFGPADATTRWFNAARVYAYNKGIKTIYYVRRDDRNERPDSEGSLFSKARECEACAV